MSVSRKFDAHDSLGLKMDRRRKHSDCEEITIKSENGSPLKRPRWAVDDFHSAPTLANDIADAPRRTISKTCHVKLNVGGTVFQASLSS